MSTWRERAAVGQQTLQLRCGGSRKDEQGVARKSGKKADGTPATQDQSDGEKAYHLKSKYTYS